ncbi:MAG: T9SS type A sorting domain-containing protein, partial [Bacteroidota bacterium]
VYNWTGNIKFYDRARITLPPISYSNQKVNELKVSIENINGLGDSTINQEITRNWSGNISTFGAHTLIIQPDLNAGENNWIIKSQQFGILAGGGPYTNGDNSLIVESINLPILGNLAKNCYSFEIYDTGGDGFAGGGYYHLISAFGDTIATNATGAFEGSETTDFNLTWATDLEQELLPQFAQVFPNPSSGLFQVQLAERPQEAYDWKVYNLNGSLIAQGSAQNQELAIDLSNQANGIYQIVLRSSDKMWSQKLIKH